MSWVMLGDLPLNQPAPTGQGQIKRANPDVTNDITNYNNTVSARPLTDALGGGGNPMRISVTPLYACWWKIVTQSIWSTPDAAWSRADWGIDLAPVDMDGNYRTQATVYMYSVLGWVHSRCTGVYRLQANTAYTATAMWLGSPNGNNQQIWNGGNYFSISGHTFAEAHQ